MKSKIRLVHVKFYVLRVIYRDRLKTGADVLAATKQHVEDLKRELALLTPQLASKVEVL